MRVYLLYHFWGNKSRKDWYNMINCAIYPRKSKASDNSDSMEIQIESCKNYLYNKYGQENCNITVYSNDYGITGHSISKRKDFQRMMKDISGKKISIVCIMRYDRIARNMRDFCNIYHEIEVNGCELVSVSQQIDTSTPYGKNFMYQMASMAELEWALTSERYKDMHSYKIAHGLAYTGKLPRFGFKIEKIEGLKRVVHDRDAETRDIFAYLLECKSKNETVRYVRSKYDADFTRRMLEAMVNSDLYIGKVRENTAFCEPYFTEAYMEEVRKLNFIKSTPTGNHYLFTGLLHCPICGRSLSANPNSRKGNLYVYYRCPNSIQSKHEHYAVAESVIENALINDLNGFLEGYLIKIENLSPDKKKDKLGQIKSIEDSMKRIDHLFEMGRLDIDEYDKKIADAKKKIESLRSEISDKEVVSKNIIQSDWFGLYSELNQENKMIFWHGIIDEIVVNIEKNIDFVRFK